MGLAGGFALGVRLAALISEQAGWTCIRHDNRGEGRENSRPRKCGMGHNAFNPSLGAAQATAVAATIVSRITNIPDRILIERRINRRVNVNYWASIKHPLLGTVTGEIQDMSISGVSMTLDEEKDYSVMMELDIELHGEGWDETALPLPVQVVRIQNRELALQFLDTCEEFWIPPETAEYRLGYGNGDVLAEFEELNKSARTGME